MRRVGQGLTYFTLTSHLIQVKDMLSKRMVHFSGEYGRDDFFRIRKSEAVTLKVRHYPVQNLFVSSTKYGRVERQVCPLVLIVTTLERL